MRVLQKLPGFVVKNIILFFMILNNPDESISVFSFFFETTEILFESTKMDIFCHWREGPNHKLLTGPCSSNLALGKVDVCSNHP